MHHLLNVPRGTFDSGSPHRTSSRRAASRLDENVVVPSQVNRTCQSVPRGTMSRFSSFPTWPATKACQTGEICGGMLKDMCVARGDTFPIKFGILSECSTWNVSGEIGLPPESTRFVFYMERNAGLRTIETGSPLMSGQSSFGASRVFRP
jgi:hypothetical protein